MLDAMVWAPRGLGRAGRVREVPPDTVLDGSGGRLRLLDNDGKQLADLGPVSRRASERAELADGWITDAQWANQTGTPVSRFSTTWVVPPAPLTGNGQTIFLFNGMSPRDGEEGGILHPVLQWSDDGAQDGPCWSVASWYVGATRDFLKTKSIRVDVGDELTGIIKLTSSTGGYSYTCGFAGIPGTGLKIEHVNELINCSEALEAYGLTTCSDYPNTLKTSMRDIELRTGSTHPELAWFPFQTVSDCGQHTVVVDGSSRSGRIDLFYKGGPVAYAKPTIPARSRVSAVSGATDKLDVFVTDASGAVVTAAWRPDFADWWHGWWPLNAGRAAPGSPVHAVSSNKDQLAVFLVGTDGHVYTAACADDPADGKHHWRGWERLLNAVAAPGAHVTAVSRGAGKLDVFVVGTDGYVYTARKSGSSDLWHGWTRIGDVRAPQGSPVHCLSRSTDKLDIYLTDTKGVIHTAAWEPKYTDGWHGWWPLRNGHAAPGAPVTAVSRGTDKLDVFMVGTDGHVYTASWQPDFADGWHGWTRIGDVRAPQGAAVHCASRNTDKLDIFVTDTVGTIQIAAWEAGGAWRAWRARPLADPVEPGAPVTAVSRSTDKLDAFVVGADGHVYTAASEPDFLNGWSDWNLLRRI